MLGRYIGIEHLFDLGIRHFVEPHDAPIEFLRPLIFRGRDDDDRGFSVLRDNTGSASARSR